MHHAVTARRRWVNSLAAGWVESLAVGWVNSLAENPLPWVNFLAAGWVNSLAVQALKWVVCVAVDNMLGCGLQVTVAPITGLQRTALRYTARRH